MCFLGVYNAKSVSIKCMVNFRFDRKSAKCRVSDDPFVNLVLILISFDFKLSKMPWFSDCDAHMQYRQGFKSDNLF